MIELSVNVNKIALLRNSRGGPRPDLLEAARIALRAGAYGITVHPRPDQRHVRADDVPALAELLREEFPAAEFNIEGNPFADANADGYPGLLALARTTRPHQVTLVPDSDDQLTSDHGWRPAAEGKRLTDMVAALQETGARVSLFMDPDADLIDEVPATGAERIELYTGPFAQAFAADGRQAGPVSQAALDRFGRATAHACGLGLGVNAGHDLDLDNLVPFRRIAGLLEVSIGHALVSDALEMGLYGAVRRYLAVLDQAPDLHL